jgi:hypothetical protein
VRMMADGGALLLFVVGHEDRIAEMLLAPISVFP